MILGVARPLALENFALGKLKQTNKQTNQKTKTKQNKTKKNKLYFRPFFILNL